ncbi:MAG: phytoene/squalene synthase family protein, partial [Bryobacteraceae bacterium]
RYSNPRDYFHQMIDGVRSDLEPRQVQTVDERYRYCSQVASVVGRTSVHIFGFDSPSALKLAEKCGIAFQMTNILRDVKEDAERGRVYLPREDLDRFAVASPATPSPQLHKLLDFEAQRAREFYREAEPLVGMVHHRSRASLWALIEIYHRLLERIIASGYDVHARPISLPAWEKAAIVLQAYLKRSNLAGLL